MYSYQVNHQTFFTKTPINATFIRESEAIIKEQHSIAMTGAYLYCVLQSCQSIRIKQFRSCFISQEITIGLKIRIYLFYFNHVLVPS
jgi:hypothetical protein